MKTLKIFSLLLIAFLSFNCGGSEDDDPKPTKTNLELAKEKLVGYFDLSSIKVEKTGESPVTFNGGCDESNLPAWAAANTGDIDYNVASDGTNLQVRINCPSLVTDTFQYSINETAGKITISITDGRTFELITDPKTITAGATVQLKCVAPLLQGATASTWTFQKK